MQSDSGTGRGLDQGCPGLHAMLQLADSLHGIDAIERMLLAYAVHPQGLDFERAHLLLHDAEGDALIAWTGSATPGAAMSLVEYVTRTALTPAPPSLHAPERRVKWNVAALEGLAHLAWVGDPVAMNADEACAEGAVLLRGAERRHGLLVGGWRDDRDAEERRERLLGFHRVARHVLRAFERRRTEQRARLQVETLAGLARAAVSSLNVAEVLHLAAESAVRAVDATGAAVWLGRGPETLQLEVVDGIQDSRERAGRDLHNLALDVWSRQKARWIDHPAEEELLPPEFVAEIAAAVVLPIAAYGHVFGAIAVYVGRDGRPAETRGFDQDARHFLHALGDHVAMALDQAERCAGLQRAAERERELRHRVQRSDALAEYAHEIGPRAQALRQPVASILAFARRAKAAAEGRDEADELLEIVLREAERLDALLGGIEPPQPPQVPRVERVQPNELVQQSLQHVGEVLVRRRIRLVKKLSPELPALLLDRERVREALRNLVGNAVESISVGGRLKVESRKASGHVVIEVAHDGAHEPGSALDRLFVPFSGSASPDHPSLGLVERIVREHGGEIRTRREGEWSSIVTFTLPIHENEDRRRAAAERRRSGDRRLRFPEALSG